MKIIDGKCPYCSSPVDEKPGKVKKEITCGSCGRILTLLPESYYQSPDDEDGFKTLEPGLFVSFFISIAVAFNTPFITAVIAVSGFLTMVLLYTNEAVPGLSGDLRNRSLGSSARLKIFPFELYLVPIWGFIVVLQLFGFDILKLLLLSVMMMLSALMAIQANRLYLDKKIKTTELSLTDFGTFINILINPQTAFEKRKYEGVHVDVDQSQQLFSKSAAKKQEIDQQREDELMSDELQKKKNILSKERKHWEQDMMNRYNSWLTEESARLISEKA